MLEICPSGLMSGIWKRSTYVPPRQISTLHAQAKSTPRTIFYDFRHSGPSTAVEKWCGG
jgi:hypothetical protein